MREESKTLFIPLYAKAEMSRRGVILSDKSAEKIWSEVAFPLGRKSRSKWLMYFMAMRARVFDDWVRLLATNDEDAVILHIGCGLDARVERVNVTNNWYDIDLSDVIELRRHYYEKRDKYTMLEGNILDPAFLENIPSCRHAIIVLEGVSMYVSSMDMGRLLKAMESKFERLSILMDAYTVFGAKMSKYKNPINDVASTKVYGMDSPIMAINNTSIKYLAEHSMTPQYLIDELRGLDKHFFSAMFTGRMVHKTYRLYEYKK